MGSTLSMKMSEFKTIKYSENFKSESKMSNYLTLYTHGWLAHNKNVCWHNNDECAFLDAIWGWYWAKKWSFYCSIYPLFSEIHILNLKATSIISDQVSTVIKSLDPIEHIISCFMGKILSTIMRKFSLRFYKKCHLFILICHVQ